MRIKPPTEEQFEIALLWLENNEGVGREQDACRAVANWMERWRSHRMLRDTARQAGVPIDVPAAQAGRKAHGHC